MHKVSYQEKARTQVSASQQDSQRLYKDHQVTGNSPEDMQAWSDFPKFQCFPFFVTLKVKLVRIKKKKERERESASSASPQSGGKPAAYGVLRVCPLPPLHRVRLRLDGGPSRSWKEPQQVPCAGPGDGTAFCKVRAQERF